MNKSGKNSKEAVFNYVYVEAVKQKLLDNGGDALKYLEECIKINPKSDAAYYQMAQILVANGDISNGKHYIEKAISIDKQNIWYLMMLAGMYYQQKNLDSAIIYYEKAIKYFPDKLDLQMTLGSLYSENRNYDKADLIFNSLDEKLGVNESSTITEIKNLITTEKYDTALSKIMLLLKQNPDEILYNGLLAEIYGGKGEKDRAIAVYKQLIDRNPGNAQVQLSLCDFMIKEKSYDSLFDLLNTIILNNNVNRDDKVSLFARLIELPDLIEKKSDELMISLMVLEENYTEDDIVPLLRIELLIKKEKFIEASERLEEIIKSKPENYYAWEKLLLVYLQLKDYEKLMIRGEECATNFNRSFLAKILYANGAMEIGKFDIALEELKKAEILAQDNKDSVLQVLTMRADIYYRMKDYSKAFETFESALKSDKEDLTVLNNYAYYLAEQNMKLKEAEKMARKVIEKDKNNATFLDTYAWVLYKRGKVKEADKIMETIMKSNEKPDATLYEHYGFILKKEKKCDKAIENWNIAMKLDTLKNNLINEINNCGK